MHDTRGESEIREGQGEEARRPDEADGRGAGGDSTSRIPISNVKCGCDVETHVLLYFLPSVQKMEGIKRSE